MLSSKQTVADAFKKDVVPTSVVFLVFDYSIKHCKDMTSFKPSPEWTECL